MNFDWAFFWDSLFHPSTAYLNGLLLTVVISLVSMFLGLVLGLVLALMRLSRNAILRCISAVYVWVMRGIPILVILVIIYLGLAAAGIYKFQDATVLHVTIAGSIQASLVGLTLNQAAYISEIIRSSVSALPDGQMEASLAMGMTKTSAMRWIILPQAVRSMIPPLGNQFNQLMKNTSLLSIIGVSEIFLITQSISSATFRTFEIFIVTGIYYLLLTTIWTFAQNQLEALFNRRLGIPTPSLSSRIQAQYIALMRNIKPSAEAGKNGASIENTH